MPAASGTIAAAMAAIMNSAACHWNVPMSPCATGSITNCPTDPPAAVRPSAALRFSTGTWRATTPRTTPNVVPARPSPISTPELPSSAPGVAETAMSARPATYSTAAPAMARPAPSRSEMAPNTGLAKPHTRFWTAKASENASRDQPFAAVMGGMNTDAVARTPIAMQTMAAPQAITTHAGREEE